MSDSIRREFHRAFAARFFLRAHMALILAAVGLAGLLVSKLLLELGLVSLPGRYLLAVAAGYVAFVGLVHLWLRYVAPSRRKSAGSDSGLDWPDAPTPRSGGRGGDAFQPGGGRFGGGGASGTFEEPTGVAEPAASVAESAGSALAEADEALPLVAVLAALALAAAAALYLIWLSPALLLELAFQVLMGSGFLGAARRLDTVGRTIGIVRATLPPFLAVVLVAVAVGWLAQAACPAATRLADVVAGCRPGR